MSLIYKHLTGEPQTSRYASGHTKNCEKDEKLLSVLLVSIHSLGVFSIFARVTDALYPMYLMYHAKQVQTDLSRCYMAYDI